MASGFYTAFKQLLGNSGINLSVGDYKVVLVTSDYNPNLSADNYLNDIPAPSRVATLALTGVTFAGGAFSADDGTINVTPTGVEVVAMVLYRDTAVEFTSPLMLYIDDATGLPLTTDGSGIDIDFIDATNRIFY